MDVQGDENSKWKRMYRILFPDVELNAIPDGSFYDASYFVAPIDPNLESWQQTTPPEQHDTV